MKFIFTILSFSLFLIKAQVVDIYPNGQLKWRAKYSGGNLGSTPIFYESWDSNGAKTAYYKTTFRRTKRVFWNDKHIRVLYESYRRGQPLSCTVSRRVGDTTKFIIPDSFPCLLGNKMVYVTNQIAYDSFGNRIKNNFRGKVIMRHDNGQLSYKYYYVKGQVQGKKRGWDKEGNLILYEVYRRGKLKRKII